MDAWTCPHCWQPMELHKHLGANPTTGAPLIYCLFKPNGRLFEDRYPALLELVRDAYELASGTSSQYVPVLEYGRVQRLLDEFRQESLAKYGEMEREVTEMEAALQASYDAKLERLRDAHEEELERLRSRVRALEAERDDLRDAAATAGATN